MNFYAKCMRNGSLILFWVAIVVAVIGFVGVLGNSWSMISSGLASPYEDHTSGALMLMLTALASALSSAAWPFFGSALIWLLDKRVCTSEEAE